MIALRKVAARLRNRKFTASEVAAMFGLSTPQANNLIDEVVPLGIVEKGNGKRLIEYRGLFAIPVVQDLIKWQLAPELRMQALAQALAKQTKRVDIPGTSLSILISGYRESARQGMTALYGAEENVQSSPEIMQGEPCVSGTRISAYILAAIAEKHGVKEALRTYPSLSEEQIEYAQVYAKARPRKGRPKTTVLPSKPKTTTRIPITKNKAGRVEPSSGSNLTFGARA